MNINYKITFWISFIVLAITLLIMFVLISYDYLTANQVKIYI